MKTRLAIEAAPASYLLPTPFTQVYSPSQILIDLYNSLTDPHRSSQFLSLIHYPIILPIGPACHCGRSCLSHSFNFIYISLLPFTDPHRFSQILTLLSYLLYYLFYPTDPHRPSQILTYLYNSLTDPHRHSHSLPYLLPHYLFIGPACHCGRSRLLVSPYPIFTPFSQVYSPHSSSQIPTNPSPILTGPYIIFPLFTTLLFYQQALLFILAGPASYPPLTPYTQIYSPLPILKDPHKSLPYYLPSRPGLSLWQVPPPIFSLPHLHKFVSPTVLHRSSPIPY